MERAKLYSYFDKKAEELLAKHKTSSEQKAPKNIGDNREFFVNDFIKTVLPSMLSIKSGEVWDRTGFKTGQMDIIIIRDDAPSLDFGGKNAYLAEGVFAVIEVKSNLTVSKLGEAARTLGRVEQLQIPKPTILMGGYNLGRPLRVLFAYTGVTWKTLEKAIDKHNWQELFDLICILDRGILARRGRLMFLYNKETGEKIEKDIIVETKASALGFLYYYLVQYGTSFSTGVIQLEEYFTPLEKWAK